MIKRSENSYYFVAIAMLLCMAAPSVAWAAKAPRPFLSADVDGDGKKDGFFRIFTADRHVEIGVRLTKSHNEYVKIYVDEIKDYRKSNFIILKRQELLDHIRVGCEEGCPNYRLEAISILEKSTSPEVVNVAYDASAKALCMDGKGEMTEAWYSD